jgi:predicted choloylglycine hydrolase
MHKRYVVTQEDRPGEAWLARFNAGREAAERWYRGECRTALPTATECRLALQRHMPELLPHYDEACALVGDDEAAHCLLSHYRPAPSPMGCSQAVWLGEGGPALVRNMDFPLDMITERFELTAWSGKRVMAKAQRPWGGCLDGMNEDGLVASLTAGGGQSQGLGFSVILMLRYVLETCRRVDEAVEALSRIPIALSQNVTLLDRSGAYATVFLGPDRAPVVSRVAACTNHQETPPQPRAGNTSAERLQTLLAALDEPAMTLASLIARFLEPPLYSRRVGFTTAYTAVYRPAEGRVDYLWPGRGWCQRFDRFVAGEYVHDFGELET